MKELTRLISSISNNVNQIARRTNETGNPYPDVTHVSLCLDNDAAGIAEELLY